MSIETVIVKMKTGLTSFVGSVGNQLQRPNQALQPTAPLRYAFDVDLSYVRFNSDSS
jgi:hypothetical protein